jgi:catechol 2,3-dioxygenase-like lactoylglutathione lyase family enzyme
VEVAVPAFFGFDHADVRVASLVAVETFYDVLMPELGLPVKAYGFVDAAGDWHEPDDAHPYNTVEYHETLVPGEPEHFVAFTEDPGMRPTATRLAFRVASVAEVVRWRARLLELGAHHFEVGDDFDDYPAVFFSDPAGTLLEICARKAKS